MLSTMCCQASDIAASGSAMAETVPAVLLRVLIERATAAWVPNKVCTAAANHHGGAAPIPLLWPHSGFSNAATGSKRTQIPGEISFIVSMVRQSETGTRCSRVLLPRNSSSRQKSASSACETRSADAAVARSTLR